jgi:hypothetical protein
MAAVAWVVERIAVLAVIATRCSGRLAHLMLALGLEGCGIHTEAAARRLRELGADQCR